ncbi:hypothetical protein NM688_g1433 [Phlebia brevispora]|uniref:Uncharacterized protein n=1 Tax=Phlebia brevispora TaxID=194682 RepID=A0ACC1TBI5_9APHY|nr:hypothetical protein NM688_g1433 [Phlebia brevispora]
MSSNKMGLPPSDHDLDEPPSFEYHEMSGSFIAIEPPASPRTQQGETRTVVGTHSERDVPSSALPPSFESAQFDIILRHQRQRPRGGGGTKFTGVPSRFLHLSNAFEFSGWGTLSNIDLSPDDVSQGQQDVKSSSEAGSLGQFTASALAGNAVLGSVFYALPAVVAVSTIYSPISLLIATSMLFLWRPVMEELASALPISGAPYTYILNVSSKYLALISAALLLLDYAATSVVSAATAMTYLNGEVSLPFPIVVGALLVLILFTMISLSGLRDSARIALSLLTLHMVTMAALFVASIVAWARMGNVQLRANWKLGQAIASKNIARQIFDGACIGVLGLTGFECVPSYAASIKTGRFPKVLRNLHYPAILLNVLSILFVLALVPLESALAGANVLSLLSQIAAGKWLRTWIVVDAMVVLCGGVLTGILGACELFERLARDRLLPQLFLRRLPITHAPGYSIICFATFSYVLYASSGASLPIVSKMFSLIWLMVMTLFPLAVLLLKYNRGRLPRTPKTSVLVVFLTLAIAAVVIGGNIAIDPTTIGYAAAYFAAISSLFYVTMKKARVVHWILWLYDQMPYLHALAWTKRWGDRLTTVVRLLRRQPVCILVKTDEINILFHKLLYVTQNEETSCLRLIHFYDEEVGVPSEMEANWKILDEAFPEITVDLILIRGEFVPSNVAALSRKLGIPTSLMFMSCPGPNFPHGIAEFGTRIISL